MADEVFIQFLVDCSGSMSSKSLNVSTAMQRFMRDLAIKGNLRYHVQIIEIGRGDSPQGYVRSSEVSPPSKFAGYTLVASGGTPLFDGIARAMNTVNDPAGMGYSCMCVLITDGSEAGSIVHRDWDEIRDFIRDKVATGWHFAYLAIGGSAVNQAQQIAQVVAEEDASRMFFADADPTSSHTAFFDKVTRVVERM